MPTRPVIAPVVGEEGVAGTVIAMEFIDLAIALQRRFGLVDLLDIGVRVLVAEQSHDRAFDAFGQINRRDQLFRGQVRLVDHDIAAPAIDCRLDAGAEPAGAILPAAG